MPPADPRPAPAPPRRPAARRRTTVGRRVGPVDREEGAAAVVLLLLTPALFGVAGLVVDGGRALTARERAVAEAEQAARAAADTLDIGAYRATGTVRLDPAAAEAAALRYLAATGDTGTVTVTATDVQVTVTAAVPTTFLGVIGLTHLHVAGQATARTVRGITTETG